MVDTDDVDGDILTANALYAFHFLKRVGKQSLRTENLVATAVSADFGEFTVKRANADGHGVRIVDDPSLGAVFANVCGDLTHHGNGAERTEEAACARGVTNGLIDAVLFGCVNVGFHFVERAGQDRDDDEISARHRFLSGSDGLVFPLVTGEFFTDHLIVARGIVVDVVQIDRTGHIVRFGKVIHQRPCPSAGAAADVSNLQILDAIVFVNHNKLHSAVPWTAVQIVDEFTAFCNAKDIMVLLYQYGGGLHSKILPSCFLFCKILLPLRNIHAFSAG